MPNVELEASYNEETNISILRFINAPKTKEDVDYIVSKASSMWKGDGKHKSWNITDLTKMGMSPPKLTIYYHKLMKPIIPKYIEDYVVIAGSRLEIVATRLFNVFIRERHPVVSTMEEAQEVVKKWQEERGVFPSLHGE